MYRICMETEQLESERRKKGKWDYGMDETGRECDDEAPNI